MQCMLVDVVKDDLNYFPSMSRKNDFPITSPEMAWKAVRKLYPEYPDDEFKCWTEYEGYYLFSLDCGAIQKVNECSFICVLYVPKGGDEFWYFVPRT